MWVRSVIAGAVFSASGAHAAEPSSFGDWTAFCAADAGCAMATAARDGHRLAFSEPNTGEDRMVFLPVEPIRRGSTMTVTMDGGESGKKHKAELSLKGYSSARAWVTSRQ